MNAELIALRSRPYPHELRTGLRRLAGGEPATAAQFVRTARRLGELHADLAAGLVHEHLPPDSSLDFVVAHGQTIFHAGTEHLSRQLLDPWPIVRQLNVPVCYDLRQADLIAGGQGAPIMPLADWVLFRAPSHARVIVNLGGICNLTRLPRGDDPMPRESIDGGDIGPCNLLIDGVVRRLFPDREFDKDGHIAAQADWPTIHATKSHPMLDTVAAVMSDHGPLNTLGREQFSDPWLDELVDRLAPTTAAADLVGWAVETVARTIASAIAAFHASDVVLAGGGALNPNLVQRIRERLAIELDHAPRVYSSDEMGIPAGAREAMGMAVLGGLCLDGEPITTKRVTGAVSPGRAGAWVYP